MATDDARVTQVMVEAYLQASGDARITQIVSEDIIDNTTTTSRDVRISQLMAEAVVPVTSNIDARISQLMMEVIVPAATFIDNTTSSQKYRILVYNTQDLLVAVYNNVRSFDFNDVINGGSADGQFTISLNTGTIDAPAGLPNQSNSYNLQATANTTDDFDIPVLLPSPGTASFHVTNNVFALGSVINVTDGNNAAQFTVTLTSGTHIEATLDFIITGIVGATIKAGAAVALNVSSAFQQPFQYNYRVQMYLEDSQDPWYDGRINGFDPTTPDASYDDEYVVIHTEGWQNHLDDGIVTETINPGTQPNGVVNPALTADVYESHLLITYSDASRFNVGPYIAPCPVNLDPLQFQGEGLAQCINDLVTQVQDNTGNTFEWWARGLEDLSVGVVIQPNMNPNYNAGIGQTAPMGRIAPTATPIHAYFIFEIKDQSIYNYTVTNSSRSLYNMIALYGGRDPVTQIQAYGAFEDSISISLYGLRQKTVTNDNLLTSDAMNNYAVSWLLQNGYPQPQTTYTKFNPTDKMRAGVWAQVLEPGLGIASPQALHQVRAIQVECQLQEDQEKIDMIVTAAAPKPFIDHAFYGALQASKNNVPVTIVRGGTVNQNTYIVSGGDWQGVINPVTVFDPVTAQITPPIARFGNTTTAAVQATNDMVALPKGTDYIPAIDKWCYDVLLQDSNTGATGDGAYDVCLVTDQSEFITVGSPPATPGFYVVQVGGPSGIGGSLNSGNVQQAPSSPNLQRLWQFVVINSTIQGATDMRARAGNVASPPGGPQFQPIITLPDGQTILTGQFTFTPYIFSGSQFVHGWATITIPQVYIWFGDYDGVSVTNPYTGDMSYIDTLNITLTFIDFYHQTGDVIVVPDNYAAVAYGVQVPVAQQVQPVWVNNATAVASTLNSATAPYGSTGMPGIPVFITPLVFNNVQVTAYSPQGHAHFIYALQVTATCRDGTTISNGAPDAGTLSGLPVTLPGVPGTYYAGLDITNGGGSFTLADPAGGGGTITEYACTVAGTTLQ